MLQVWCRTLATNDVAVAWPPADGPVLIAAYCAESKADDDAGSAVLAEVGRIAASFFADMTGA